MNTPEPCGHCKFLYADCMQEDDPSYMAECWHGHSLGNMHCACFKHWEEGPRDEDKTVCRWGREAGGIWDHYAKLDHKGNFLKWFTPEWAKGEGDV